MNSFSRLICTPSLVFLLSLSAFDLPGKAHYLMPSSSQTYQEALKQIESFKLDSARMLLNQLIARLDATRELQSPFGMQVRLKRAEALEKANEDEAAIEQLLNVSSDSKQQQQWPVFANAQLSIARLHEKHQRPKLCHAALREAQMAINTFQLDSIYPRFAIRMSSYHRVFDNKQTALFYAKEAIRTAPNFNQLEFLGNGYMLTGMLLRPKYFEAAAVHFLKAADIFDQLGNKIGYMAMLCNLSSLYKDYQQLGLALKYSNDYWAAYLNHREKGNEGLWLLSNYYEIRSRIMAESERHDSAYHYLQLAFESRLKLMREESREKAVEIQARFDDRQKALKIEEQAQLLRYEAIQRKWGVSIALLSLFFAGLVLFFYFKLKNANERTRYQAATINRKNEELGEALQQQIMLQGEIHHRVKNNLQVIISLLDLQREEVEDPQALSRLESMSNRIYSMAAVHEILYTKKGGEAIRFTDYAQNLCDHFRQIAPEHQTPHFHLDVEQVMLNLETLMPLGIMLNELMTNSQKYACMPHHQLEIDIHLQACGDGYCLTYRDNGPGFADGKLTEREGGLGSYLLRSMARQLKGRIRTHNDNGAVYQIFFKAKNQYHPQYELSADTYR